MSTSPISSSGPLVSPYSSGPAGAFVPPVPDPRDALAGPPLQSAPREPDRRGAHKPVSTHALLRKHAASLTLQSSVTSPAAPQSPPTSAARFAADMVGRYDGGSQSRNHGADLKSAMVLWKTARLAMTGLPRDEVQVSQDEQELASALAQMDPATRKQFEQRAEALRTVPQDGYEAASSSLHQDVDQEMRRVESDPVSRMNAVFNAPVGIGLLGEDGQKQMAALLNEATKMNTPGATPTQREQAYAGAVGIKSRMQDQILQKSQDIHATQKKLWDESTARVNQILDDTGKYRIPNDTEKDTPETLKLPSSSDDPQWDGDTRLPAYAKTFPYQSVMEKLLSPDGYSQQERSRSTARTLPPEDRTRDLLTFQEGMSEPGSDIHQRVTKLEQQALSTMASPGPDLDAGTPATTLSSVAAHPPKYDQNYVQNLAAGYQGALQDTDKQIRTMLRQDTGGPLDKALYAIGRFVADLSPIPGMDWLATKLLDASFPNQGGLTGQQVRNIDLGAMFTGLLLGRGEPEAAESALKPVLGGSGEGALKLKPGPTGNPSPTVQPPVSGATAGPAFTPGGMPEAYALENMPSSYSPSATPGVYVDTANGQKFILADNQAFAVKYDKDNTTYRIYDPANPTRPTYPVRHDSESGKWEIHQDVGLQGGTRPISAETKLKAKELLSDGWMQKDVATLLGISPNSVSRIQSSFINPDPWTMPLCSDPFRQEVIAQLNAGAPREQIARDKHIQPETVDYIDQHYRRDRHAPQQATGARQPTASAAPCRPASPQPGTSTGGHTDPSAKRPRVDSPQPSGREAMTSEVLRQVADQIPAEQIAKNLGLTPEAIDETIERYVMDETRKLHEEFLAEQARQPIAAAHTPFVPPATRQDVIHRLNNGQTLADIAAHSGLTALQVDQIKDQYLQEELAHFNADLLRQ
ncbi:hypothetical protein SAMN02787142_1938 [Burkholderia sp. WP9]|uniref:helix-turn-helix domain-containing protein n=1 Tax=Burkholderia sp. WP9 TaxID=1500263 RepID=UPI0008995454|nr:helix-turn-helix domain-containing protein [Burkholderia sp. WP9]SEC77446.1 hypothetical protein SAMN02787142_1938 [Burkholderia sp. WP9]